MSEYYRKNQYYNYVNYEEYRYSLEDSRVPEPESKAEVTIEIECYECGIRVLMRIPYRIKKQMSDINTSTMTKIEENLCSKCREDILNRQQLEILCSCGVKHETRVGLIKKGHRILCQCGRHINLDSFESRAAILACYRRLQKDNNWYHLL